MLRNELGQKTAIHAPRHIVPSGDGEKRARVIVEANRIVKAGSLRYLFAEAHHSFRAIVKPPRRPEPQARIMPRQRREFAAVGGFIEREKNDGVISLVAELIEQRTKCIDVVYLHRNVSA